MAELFDRFEVNRVPRWPLMTRLVALSVVLHGLFFVAIIYVPTLKSLLHVAGGFAGIEFVSEDYDRTLIGQRATIVNLNEPYEKLYYPPDYFGLPPEELASPTDPLLMEQAVAPPPPPVVISRPRRVRTPRAVTTPTPETFPSPEEIVAASPTPSPADDAEKKAKEAELDKLAKEHGVERPPNINTKPFEELATKGKEMLEQGKLNLDSKLDVTATAQRNEDGTLNRETVKIEGLPDDPLMAQLAQELITALSESKVFRVLNGVQNMRLSLTMNQENVIIKVMGETESPDVAAQKALGYKILVGRAKSAKAGTSEGELYNRLSFDSDGNQFIMSFEMPKADAGKMIKDMLAKKAAEAAAKS